MCSGSLDVAPIDDGLEDDFEEPPHIVNTKIHVTTLDVIVSVNGFFCDCGIFGISTQPPVASVSGSYNTCASQIGVLATN